ncbi:MAG: helix-turn-helix transcriptional regulator [Nitrospinae bacterium]|nr:helix-turn-helix transcriptional regulator [Nitrospinota bacterium]
MAAKNPGSGPIPENLRPVCPVQKTISIIQAKWALFILHNLLAGKKRFGQLRKSLNGVSPKTLSLRLKELEDAGILKREIFAEVPPRVEYSLTEKGSSLGKVIGVVSKWGEKWMPEEPAQTDRVPKPANAGKNVVNIRSAARSPRGRGAAPKQDLEQSAV